MRKRKVILDEELLVDLYVNKKMSMEEVAKELNISKGWIRTCLYRLGKVRDKQEAYMLGNEKKRFKFDKSQALKLYKDGLNFTEIGNILHVSAATIKRRSDIETGIKEHKQNVRDIIKDNESQIIKWYVDDKLSPEKIATNLGDIAKDSIIRLLIKKGLRRTRLESAKLRAGEMSERMRILNSGKIPWNKGISMSDYLSDEMKHKMSVEQKERWNRNKNILLVKSLQSRVRSKSKLERAVNILLDYYYPNEFQYTGDKVVVINGYNPDFLNCNGQLKIIEAFGDYWHSKSLTGEEPEIHEKKRIRTFKEDGYDTLILWEHELVSKVEIIKNTVSKIIKFVGKQPITKDIIPMKMLPSLRVCVGCNA